MRRARQEEISRLISEGNPSDVTGFCQAHSGVCVAIQLLMEEFKSINNKMWAVFIALLVLVLEVVGRHFFP